MTHVSEGHHYAPCLKCQKLTAHKTQHCEKCRAFKCKQCGKEEVSSKLGVQFCAQHRYWRNKRGEE
jgi:hypothetical protein